MQDGGEIFGKLDALVEKRSADSLVDRSLDRDDFPELTDVIGAQSSSQVDQASDDDLKQRSGDRRQGDRRRLDRRERPDTPIERRATSYEADPQGLDGEVERLVRAMESRLGELFVNHQSQVEEMVRQAIRIELTKQRPD